MFDSKQARRPRVREAESAIEHMSMAALKEGLRNDD
jgi:hypothetical protein